MLTKIATKIPLPKILAKINTKVCEPMFPVPKILTKIVTKIREVKIVTEIPVSKILTKILINIQKPKLFNKLVTRITEDSDQDWVPDSPSQDSYQDCNQESRT